jgi:hypothetical protein
MMIGSEASDMNHLYQSSVTKKYGTGRNHGPMTYGVSCATKPGKFIRSDDGLQVSPGTSLVPGWYQHAVVDPRVVTNGPQMGTWRRRLDHDAAEVGRYGEECGFSGWGRR